MVISSELLAYYESLLIFHRKDINGILTQMVKEKKIGKVVANDRRIEVNYCINKLKINFDSLVAGSTCVPIAVSMQLAKDQNVPYKLYQ